MLRRRWKHCQLRQTDKLELGEAEFQWRSWLTWQNFPQFWRTHHNCRKTSKVIMLQQIVMKPEPKQFPINLLSKDNHIKNSDHARDQNCAKKNTQLQSSWNPVDTWKLDGSMRWLPFSNFKGPYRPWIHQPSTLYPSQSPIWVFLGTHLGGMKPPLKSPLKS